VSRCLSAPIIAASMLAAMSLPSAFAAPAFVTTFSTAPLAPDGLVAAPIGATLYASADTGSPNFFSHFLAINTQFGNITADLPLVNFSVFPNVPSRGALQIAISKDGTLLFVLNNISRTVDVVQQATNTQIATFGFALIGPNPIGIRVSPNGKQLWIANSATPPSFNNGTVQVIGIQLGVDFGTPIFLVNTGGSPNEVIFNSKGSVAFVQNGLATGFLDIVNARTFKIINNHYLFPNLNSPNPLSMDITRDNSTLYIGNGDTSVNNVDIPTGGIDDTIFMFPGIPLAFQEIGQTLISPDQKWVVTADPDISAISLANTSTNQFSNFIGLPGGSVPYFMAFLKGTLFVSNFNNTVFAPVGGHKSISVISGF
jgi:DNA-binding beta-propeller fold protein YncE